MIKNLAIGAFLLLSSILPANAGPLLSLTGTVGDANWLSIPFPDPQGPPITPGSFELSLGLGQYFQKQGGPGGLLSITYSGPFVYFSRDEEFASVDTQSAVCELAAGCVNGAGFVANFDPCPCSVHQFVPGGGTSYTRVIDSSYYVELPDIPSFAPFGASYAGVEQGYVNYIVDDFVAPGAVGQPFSVTVTAIPEPAVWTVFIAGLFGIGLVGAGRRNAAAKD